MDFLTENGFSPEVVKNGTGSWKAERDCLSRKWNIFTRCVTGSVNIDVFVTIFDANVYLNIATSFILDG